MDEKNVTDFTTDPKFVRRERELRTLETMISMYCQAHHYAPYRCKECSALADYARRRLERCVFGDSKPTCANCLVHCYRDAERETIREMMRWSGPRMMLKHPVLAIMHKLDGRRPSPKLPAKPARQVAGDD